MPEGCYISETIYSSWDSEYDFNPDQTYEIIYLVNKGVYDLGQPIGILTRVFSCWDNIIITETFKQF